jgi:hypothetical protein
MLYLKGVKKVRKQLQVLLEKRVKQCVTKTRDINEECEKIKMKKQGLAEREGEIVKAKASGKIKNIEHVADIAHVYYQVHFQYLINHKGTLYIEEEIEERKAEFYKGTLVDDEELSPDFTVEKAETSINEVFDERLSFEYDRLNAVKYAETWWNSYNPRFSKFTNDCTNYISQCLRAGGAPMTGYPNRSKGWWMQNNSWTYSWTVAHSFRWYLPNARVGLRAVEVNRPEELKLGDIICYDFEGDGRFNHTTIVTAKDADGMPLVNAHTTNSRKRYWAYKDSTAYTPNIKYIFLQINDDV